MNCYFPLCITLEIIFICSLQRLSAAKRITSCGLCLMLSWKQKESVGVYLAGRTSLNGEFHMPSVTMGKITSGHLQLKIVPVHEKILNGLFD